MVEEYFLSAFRRKICAMVNDLMSVRPFFRKKILIKNIFNPSEMRSVHSFSHTPSLKQHDLKNLNITITTQESRSAFIIAK